jgi:oxygen-independent coproporphyrinogen-3 oxidase
LEALLNEIRNYASEYAHDREIISIFFGGGTPSFMNPSYIGSILNEVYKNFKISENAEITLETNPGTVDANKIRSFQEIGINRLSIGVQSFDNEELNFLTRIHNEDGAVECVKTAADNGFENISLDLIFNIPGQTKEVWNDNIAKAVKLPIQHISTYSLILERGTILNKMVLDGKVQMQDSDFDAELYKETIEYLEENEFRQYEVSNFAKPGYECVHNKTYWNYTDYLGFGTSAHSFVNGVRWWNFSGLTFYLAKMGQHNSAVAGSEVLTKEEKTEEIIMLSLRSGGLDLQMLEQFDGGNWWKKNKHYLKSLNKDGYISISDNFIKFTKSGYALCDEILLKLL